MSLVLVSPISGTLDFGTVPVGGISNAMITWTDDVDNDDESLISPSGTIGGIATSEVISGADATQFQIVDMGTFTINAYFSTPGFSTVQFKPLTIGAFTAQIVYNYATTVGGGPGFSGPYATSPVILMGTGGSVPAGGEAPFLVQSFRRELVPVISNAGVVDLNYFNENNFNDTMDNCGYIFKAEDILADRVPTVRRVILTYIDLGVATLNFTINGANDNGQIVTATKTQTIGTMAASGLLLTAFIDITITCFRPQLSINRAAGAGPIQISTVLITGTVEMDTTL